MSCSIVRQMDVTTAFLNGDIEEVMSTIQKNKGAFSEENETNILYTVVANVQIQLGKFPY